MLVFTIVPLQCLTTAIMIVTTIDITLKKYTAMAIPIKSIPTLRGKVAERFVKKAERAEKKRATVDFSEHIKVCASILQKAKI